MGANAQTTVPDFVADTVLTAAKLDISAATGVPVFATTVTRDAAFGGANKVLAQGQLCYLEATNVTQYYDGAAWATVGPAAASGLVLLQTLSPSAVTSAQFADGLLTSTYFNYVVTINVTFAAHASFLCQLRNAGSTISSANYGMYATGFGSNGATDNRVTNAGTSWIVGYGNTETLSGRFDFFSPSVSRAGNKGIGITGSINGAANANVTNNVALQFAAAQAFTSLLFTSAQAFTGTICVYGVSK